MANYVKAQDMFDQVIEHYGWNKDEDTYVDMERKRKLLRDKYTFLAKKVVLRDRNAFKQKGSHMIPVAEAPIIRELLIHAVSTEEGDIIRDWFNGKVNTEDSQMAILLFMQLDCVIRLPEMRGETDAVTTDEWLSTIKAAINYDTARVTLDMKRELECFRGNSLALNSNVHYGDIYATDETGHSSYVMKGQKEDIKIEDKTIKELLSVANTQYDYLQILSQVVTVFEEDAKNKALQRIKNFVNFANVFDAKKADDSVGEEQLASEYVIWYQRVYEFLRANPEILAEIEEETKFNRVLEFFRMQDR